MGALRTILLFLATACAEITGCYLVFLWLRMHRSAWLLIPAGVSLALFAYLLTLHPTAAGRVYAAYGGAYIFMAVVWLWIVEGYRPDRWDLIGALVSLVGMMIIYFGPRAHP